MTEGDKSQPVMICIVCNLHARERTSEIAARSIQLMGQPFEHRGGYRANRRDHLVGSSGNEGHRE